MIGLPKLSVDPVLFLPLWLGTTRDHSAHGNAVAITNAPHWTQRGSRDGMKYGSLDRLTVTPGAALGSITDFTAFVSTNIETDIGTQQILRNAGNTLYWFIHSPGQIRNYDGANQRFIAGLTLGGVGSLATTGTGASAKGELFVGGASVGLYSDVSTFAWGGSDLFVGGTAAQQFRSQLETVLIYPAVLSADEIATLHTWSQSRITPRKQWPGAGLQYPGRETELLTNGDFDDWTPVGAYAEPDWWDATNPGTAANHMDENPTGHIQIVSDGAFVGVGKSIGLVVGSEYRCRVSISEVVIGTGAIAGSTIYKTFTAAGLYDFKFIANAASLSLKRAGGPCDFTTDWISLWENLPGYTPRDGDPLYLDNIQSARVTLANQTAGQLSNTGYTIESGTWAVNEDSTSGDRYIECVANGIITRRNVEAYGTWEFGLYKGDPGVMRTGILSGTTAPSPTTYQLNIDSAENTTLQIPAVATIITASSPATAEVKQDYVITRDQANLFTLYRDGASVGSGSNAALTSGPYAIFDYDTGDRLYYDRQFAGVLPP